MMQAPENCCLLCNFGTLTAIDSIATHLVTENYNKASGINVSWCFRSIHNLSLLECSNCDLRYYNPPTPGNAAFYEALQRLPWYYQDIKPEYHFAKTHIHENDRVLEIGCGKSVFRSFLSEGMEQGTQLGFPIGLKRQMLCLFKQMMRVWLVHLGAYMCSSEVKLGFALLGKH